MIYVMGTCPHKEGESPKCKWVPTTSVIQVHEHTHIALFILGWEKEHTRYQIRGQLIKNSSLPFLITEVSSWWKIRKREKVSVFLRILWDKKRLLQNNNKLSRFVLQQAEEEETFQIHRKKSEKHRLQKPKHPCCHCW